jgi:hypothetical protein
MMRTPLSPALLDVPRKRLNRRAFMRAGIGGLAGATVAAPLLGSLGARAQAESFPTRLLVFFTPNGMNPDVWFPTPGASETDFTLGAVHQPLAAFRDRMLITSGINMESLQVGPGEPHQRGMGAVLTGTHLQEGNFVGGDGTLAGWGDGISLDQHVANHIGQSTPYKSLELGVRVLGSEVRHRINYAGPAQPLPPQVNPRQAWNTLFADIGTEPSEAAATKARRQRILAAAREQFLALRPRLSSSDLQKLDQHHTYVAEMETRLEATGELGEQCQQPAQPPFMLQPEHEDNMDEVVPLQIDMMVMALACDLTRVGTLQMSSGANNIRFPHLSSYTDDHQLSHAGPSDTTSQGEFAQRRAWYAEQFAYLLGQLDAIPEGDGTLLDHTLILWCNELAQGNTHSHANMPFLLAGGQSVGLQTGRYVQYAGARHNDLLIAMMNAMGVSGNTFGDANYCNGPLAGLFA